MIGIIYKFEIMSQVRFNGHKPFYIGQHWESNDVKFFLSYSESNYIGSGAIWLRLVSNLRKKKPNNWRKFIKREILFQSDKISVNALNKLERFYIEKEKSTIDYNLGGCNIIIGASTEVNPSQYDYVKEKIRRTLTGKLVGDKNPFYGHHHTEETRKKIKAKRKLQVITEEAKQKMKESRKDFVWITNSEKETLVNKNSKFPEGWCRGRLKFKK